MKRVLEEGGGESWSDTIAMGVNTICKLQETDRKLRKNTYVNELFMYVLSTTYMVNINRKFAYASLALILDLSKYVKVDEKFELSKKYV